MRALDHEELHNAEAIPPHIFTGRVLNNSYKIGPLIEQGAIAEIYDGAEISTGDHVAIKILLPELARDPKIQSVFLNEARTLGRLTQPGLPRYRTCATDPQSGLTYIVTDLLGMTLSAHLSAWQPNERELVGFLSRLAHALAAAHDSGLVHGHLSPDNIRVPGGKLAHAIIVNFGLSGYFDAGSRLPADCLALDGTYFAPEQLRSLGERSMIGPCTDVYSLALLVLALACGKSPDTMTRRDGVPDLSPLPRSLRPLFERMLAPEAKKRFARMAEVLEALETASDAGGSKGGAALSAALKQAQRAALAGAATPLKAVAALAASRRERAAANAAAREAARREAQAAAPAPTPPAPPPRPTLSFAPPRAASPKTDARPAPSPAARAPTAFASRQRVSLAAIHAGHDSASVRAAGLAGIAVAAVLLTAGFVAVQMLFPASKPVIARGPAPVQQEADNAYGADATSSRFTLAVRRPVQLTVFAGQGSTLWEQAMQPGELYRAPNVPDLTVSASDAGAVEVIFDGQPIGFVGKDRAAAHQVPLRRLLASALGPALTASRIESAKPAPPKPAAPTRTATAQPPAPPTPPPQPVQQTAVIELPQPPASVYITPPVFDPQVLTPLQSIMAVQAEASVPAPAPASANIFTERERAKSTADIAKAVKDLQQKKMEAARQYNRAIRNSLYGLR